MTTKKVQPKTTEQLWVVFAVYGDADHYKETSFHRTKAGADKKAKKLEEQPVWHEDWGEPRYQVFPRPLED